MITLPLAKIVGKLEAHLADRDAGNTGKKNKRKKHKAPLPEDPELQATWLLRSASVMQKIFLRAKVQLATSLAIKAFSTVAEEASCRIPCLAQRLAALPL